jgi:uncharacterized membrane protein YhhN
VVGAVALRHRGSTADFLFHTILWSLPAIDIMKNILISALYFLVVVLFMITGREELWITGFILKAMIIPVLMVLFLVNVKGKWNRLHLLILAGLFFSWVGDVLLEVPEVCADLFVPGLLSFMVAQAMYLTAFFTTPGPDIIKKKPFLAAPAILYGAILVYFLSPGLGVMKIPVIIYATVILTMLCGAVNRFEKVNRLSYWLVLTGAILFVLSDSGIAFSKFIHSFRGSSLFIMSTYVVAQYLILSGYLIQSRREVFK